MNKPSWKNRRRFMLAFSLLCAGVIIYVVGWGDDTRVHDTALTFAFLTLIAITGSYVFGATWQDVSLGRTSAPSSGKGSALP